MLLELQAPSFSYGVFDKKEICEWKTVEPAKKIVTKNDIRILDWGAKRCR